jgi:hypothetical protein
MNVFYSVHESVDVMAFRGRTVRIIYKKNTYKGQSNTTVFFGLKHFSFYSNT